MLYNKHNLAVAKFASIGNAYKREIAGVLFTDKKTVATDSYSLLEVAVPADVSAAEYPRPQGLSAMRGCKPFIADARQVAAIKLPSKKAAPVLQAAAVKHIGDGVVQFMTSEDGVGANVTACERITGDFPAYEGVMPQGKPVASVTINGAYLAKMLAAVAAMRDNEQVVVKFYGENKPVVVEGGTDNQRARGVVMPVRE